MDTDEDTQVDTEPLRVRGSTISTLIVARQAANLENDALHVKRQGDEDKLDACAHTYNYCTKTSKP